MAGIFGEFFLVSVSHKMKHENSSKKLEQNSGQNSGRKIEKCGKLSFCNFSDLTFLQEPKSEPEPPEPFSWNQNRNRNRPSLIICIETQETLPQRNRRNQKPELLEPFHNRTKPNRGHPATKELNLSLGFV